MSVRLMHYGVSLAIGALLSLLINWAIRVGSLNKATALFSSFDQVRIEAALIPVLLLLGVGVVAYEIAKLIRPAVKLSPLMLALPLVAYISWYVGSLNIKVIYQSVWPALIAIVLLSFVKRDQLYLR